MYKTSVLLIAFFLLGRPDSTQAQSMLVLKEFIGTTMDTFVPTTAPLAVFTLSEIHQLIGGIDTIPEGIRLHFDKDSNGVNLGLIAVSIGVGILQHADGSRALHNFEMPKVTTTRKYLRRSPIAIIASSFTSAGYRNNFPRLQEKGGSSINACVFFSRLDLIKIINQAEVTRIAFYRTTVQRTISGVTSTFESLVAIGMNSSGQRVGVQVRSEAPCPPHCGDDYP